MGQGSVFATEHTRPTANQYLALGPPIRGSFQEAERRFDLYQKRETRKLRVDAAIEPKLNDDFSAEPSPS
jgi:hypothetical protein